jgi:hypothetical protein
MELARQTADSKELQLAESRRPRDHAGRIGQGWCAAAAGAPALHGTDGLHFSAWPARFPRRLPRFRFRARQRYETELHRGADSCDALQRLL